MAGIIDRTNHPAIIEGSVCYFWAVDNGEGAGVVEKVSTARINHRVREDQRFCSLTPDEAFSGLPGNVILHGNVQVQGAVTLRPIELRRRAHSRPRFRRRYSAGVSAVQLECGPYGPVRFHVRLFRGERGTIGNVHLDLQLPGTSEHQVLSWALPQHLLTVDLARTGLLGAAPTPTAQTHSPFFGEIPAAIWNGMPPELRQLTGHSPTAPGPVPILSTGYAMQFELAGRVPVTPDEEVEDFVVQWNQIIPKPFCAASPAHVVRVEGPLRFTQRSGIDASGEYHMEMLAQGTLRITPINPPDGSFESYDAEILVNHVGTVTDPMTKTLLNDLRRELPDIGIFRRTSHDRVQTGPTTAASMHLLDVDC